VVVLLAMSLPIIPVPSLPARMTVTLPEMPAVPAGVASLVVPVRIVPRAFVAVVIMRPVELHVMRAAMAVAFIVPVVVPHLPRAAVAFFV